MGETQEFRRQLSLVGLSQMELARAIGYDPRTVRRWALGERRPPDFVMPLLEWLHHRLPVPVAPATIELIMVRPHRVDGRYEAISYDGVVVDRAYLFMSARDGLWHGEDAEGNPIGTGTRLKKYLKLQVQSHLIERCAERHGVSVDAIKLQHIEYAQWKGE